MRLKKIIKNRTKYTRIVSVLFVCYFLYQSIDFTIITRTGKSNAIASREFARDRSWFYPVRGKYLAVVGYESLRGELLRIVPTCCRLIHMNILGRHATRYPLNLLNGGAETLVREDVIPSLKELFRNFNAPKEGVITTFGRKEWVNLASRIKNIFPEFLNMSKLIQLGRFIVEHNGGERNSESGFWYAHQLLKMDNLITKDPILGNLTAPSDPPKHPERYLEKYFTFRAASKLFHFDSCKNFFKYRREQAINRSKLVDSDVYLKQQAQKLTKQYCSVPSCAISTNGLISLHDFCGFQLLLHNNESICQHWPTTLLEKLAWVTDVMKYYDSSYGTGYAENLGCGISRVIIEDMEKAIGGWNPSHVVRMVIQESILPLLTIGKVFPRDNTLNWTEIPRENWDRTFHMNKLSPMTANVIFLLYDCSACNNYKDKLESNKTDPEYKVLTLLNERVVKTPYYSTEVLNSFEDFKRNFQPCSEREMEAKCGEL